MLDVIELYKEFPSDSGTVTTAMDHISFHVPKGSVFTLLGPSGCGKTTTLRSIAGLERPSSGMIRIEDREVYNSQNSIFLQPNQRDIGMVFQSYAIWPHMDVFENVAFPLRAKKKYPKEKIKQKVSWALEMVQLKGFEHRQATKLSGGQQQRLAIARALVHEPALLLLDEPLANLDAKLREHVREELKKLQRELGITTVYVTHDQTEALALSDVIAVLRDGKIIQIGSPREIYERPNSRFVANFVGTSNFIVGKIQQAVTGNIYKVETKSGVLLAGSIEKRQPGEKVIITIRPENIALYRDPPQTKEGVNLLEGRSDFEIFLGEMIDMKIVCGKEVLRVREHPSWSLPQGETVYAQISAESCVIVSYEEVQAAEPGFEEKKEGEGEAESA